MAKLPPDLERLGEVLTDSTTRTVAMRRHRRHLARLLAVCVAAGTLVFAATPNHLGPASPPTGGMLGLAQLDQAYGMVRDPCDPLHGAGGPRAQAATGCMVEGAPPQAR